MRAQCPFHCATPRRYYTTRTVYYAMRAASPPSARRPTPAADERVRHFLLLSNALGDVLLLPYYASIVCQPSRVTSGNALIPRTRRSVVCLSSLRGGPKMGRLGFNLVRQKEANKNVESGAASVVIDQQQNENETNENVEIGELLIAIDKANRTIKNYRWLSVTLVAVIVTLCGYIFVTQAQFHSTQSVVHTLTKMHEEYSNRIAALQGDNEAQAEKFERSQNAVLEESMQRQLEEQKESCKREILEASEKYNELQESYGHLQAEAERIKSESQKTESILMDKLAIYTSEQANLLAKIEESKRQLELQKSESQKQPTTTTTTTTTTTSRPRFFGSNQLKKLNDLIKDIESVGRIVGNVFREGI